MNKVHSFTTIFVVSLVTFFTFTLGHAQNLPPKFPTDSELATAEIRLASLASNAVVEGAVLDIAVDPDFDESDPSVALCAGDQYLVVFEYGSEIYAQYLDNAGNRLGIPFVVSTDVYSESNPAVACDWNRNLFVVVWQHDYVNSGDMDIQAQVILGTRPASRETAVAAVLNVADSLIDETNPAIACNSDASGCLVVYERAENSGDVYGQRVFFSGSSFLLQGDGFAIGSFTAAERNPAVAWGTFDHDYLISWEYQDASAWRIVSSYVWDTLQGGSQIQTSTAFLTGSELPYNQLNPAVAYNGRSHRFLLVFQHAYLGDGSDYDIYGLRLVPGGGSQGDLITIDFSLYNNEQPAVAYGSGPYYLPGGRGADQFLVSYVTETPSGRWIHAHAIYGTFQIGSQLLSSTPIVLYQTAAGPNFDLLNPDVVGSLNNGRYLTIWESMISGFAGTDYNVRGRLVAPYSVFLPAIIR
ncbi:MAG: hypothetical protein H6657_18855 [Ardenticatenaceae bacterium]|nr:hypothetical protein [Ardenticatenaceae bacterium]